MDFKAGSEARKQTSERVTKGQTCQCFVSLVLLLHALSFVGRHCGSSDRRFSIATEIIGDFIENRSPFCKPICGERQFDSFRVVSPSCKSLLRVTLYSLYFDCEEVVRR